MAEKMKTVVFHGVNDLAVEEYDVPTPGAHQLLVRIEACAICTWEQRAYTGVNKVAYPFIGGHEIAGYVEAMGSEIDTKVWHIGDRVVCGVQLACKECDQCKQGAHEACEHFNHQKQLPGLPYHGMGGLSSHYVVETRNCFKYDNVPAEQAALVEPVSCVLHAVEMCDIQFGDIVLVIGCGIMGQLNALLAARRGAMVIVSDTNEERTALAIELGARCAINPSKENLVERVRELGSGRLADVVIDTTPIPSVAKDAISCLNNCGKVMFYSSFHPDEPIDFSPNQVHKLNLQILGSANSNERDFMRASRLISEGIISTEPFVSEVYPVERAQDAFDSACKADKYRVVITF